MRLLVQAKGAEGVVLVSDALQATGQSEGAYSVGGRPAFFMDGAIRLADGTLAGSVLTLDRALHNLQAATGRPLTELWPAASRNAAQAIGVDDVKGTPEPGKDADLVLLDLPRGGEDRGRGRVVHGGDRLPAGPPRPAAPLPTSHRRPSSKEEGPCPALAATVSPPSSPSPSPWSSGWPPAGGRTRKATSPAPSRAPVP